MQIRLATPSLQKISAACQCKTGASNCRFEFQKRRQFFICTHVSARPLRDQAHRELVYRRLQFQKRSQLLIRSRKQHSAPSFLLVSRCLPAIAHQQRIRPWCAADLFRRSASDCAQVLFEIFKAHRCELFALGWLRHRPAPFRVPSNRPAATTDIAIAPNATAQSRIMIRWSFFMIPTRVATSQVSSLMDSR
jgi:hypothetical protein